MIVGKIASIHSSKGTNNPFVRLICNFPPVLHENVLTLKISTTSDLQPPTTTISASYLYCTGGLNSVFFTRAHTCPEREVGILGTADHQALLFGKLINQILLKPFVENLGLPFFCKDVLGGISKTTRLKQCIPIYNDQAMKLYCLGKRGVSFKY